MTPLRLSTACAFAALAASPLAAAPRVAVDIAPIHSIVARVMEGAGAPDLIATPGGSPHSHSLRPSEAARLDQAELVIWVGPELTAWLATPIEALAGDARILRLGELPEITRLPLRAGGPFEEHHHDDDDHDHDHDDDHAHDEDDDHDDDHASGDDHAREAEGALDAHIWLDPLNAAAIAEAAARTLAELDPENAVLYENNSSAFRQEIDGLIDDISALLESVRGRPYLVFHDAYQYFETRFDMPAAGSVSLHDGDAPSAARIAEIRDRMRSAGVECAFAEPQYEARLLDTVTEGTGARTATLDPEGVALAPGVDLYPTLIRELADNLVDCLDG